MRKPLIVAMLCLSALLAGCAESPGPLDPSAPLDVSVASRSIWLENQSSRTIFYLVLERGYAGRVLWGPCTSPEQPCARVEPNAAARVEYSEISGYESGEREAILFWYHLLERDGGWEVDEIRSVRVRL
jgi:hypothetical protein